MASTLPFLHQQALADALHAMDLFAFASTSETQGMVLTEAMAAGLPVVALDASGAREVVKDRHNGRLLYQATPAAFSAALQWMAGLPPDALRNLKQAALDTAEAFSMSRSADRALACFEALEPGKAAEFGEQVSAWEEAMTVIKTEWDILKSMAGASDAVFDTHLFPDKKH